MACEDEQRRCTELANAAIGGIAENGVPALVELLLFARAEAAGSAETKPSGNPVITTLGGVSSYEQQRVALGYPKRGHYGD